MLNGCPWESTLEFGVIRKLKMVVDGYLWCDYCFYDNYWWFRCKILGWKSMVLYKSYHIFFFLFFLKFLMSKLQVQSDFFLSVS